MNMRLKLIACKVLYREISLLSYNSKNIIDVTYLRQGFHNTPEKLKALLQSEIDRLDSGDDIYSYEPRNRVGNDDFDAILIGYGLCSNAILGLKSKKYKLVIPRAHDCVTLFIGSKERYKEYFDSKRGGIYWYSGGWIDQTLMPSSERVDYLKKTYAEKYGEENAEFLLEAEQGWLKEYDSCTFVNWDELTNDDYIRYTKQSADYLKWSFDVLEGDSGLMKDFLNGNWNEKDFLIVPPEKEIAASYDESIITAQ